MTLLILTTLSALILATIAHKRLAARLEEENALLRGKIRNSYPTQVDIEAVKAEMDRLEVEDLIASLDNAEKE